VRFAGFAGQDVFLFFLILLSPREASRCAVFVGPQMVGKLVIISMGIYVVFGVGVLEVVYIDECPHIPPSPKRIFSLRLPCS